MIVLYIEKRAARAGANVEIPEGFKCTGGSADQGGCYLFLVSDGTTDGTSDMLDSGETHDPPDYQ